MRNSPAHFQSSPHPQQELSKTRAKLTESDALSIYHCKTSVTSASAISKLYGVSEKAVRNIWTGRTWSKETWHLDESRPFPTKKMGRPFGRKDAQPRKPRSLRTIPESSTTSQTPVDVSLASESIDIALCAAIQHCDERMASSTQDGHRRSAFIGLVLQQPSHRRASSREDPMRIRHHIRGSLRP